MDFIQDLDHGIDGNFNPDILDRGNDRFIMEIMDVYSAMIDLQKRSFNAHVVFTRSKHGRFWSFFTGKHFGHVFVLIPVYYPKPGLLSKQYTMKIEARGYGTEADFFCAPIDDVIKTIPNVTDVVRYRVNRSLVQRYVPRGLMNCVGLTKSICLVNNWKIVTPFHLYRWLRMNGGKSRKFEK